MSGARISCCDIVDCEYEQSAGGEGAQCGLGYSHFCAALAYVPAGAEVVRPADALPVPAVVVAKGRADGVFAVLGEEEPVAAVHERGQAAHEFAHPFFLSRVRFDHVGVVEEEPVEPFAENVGATRPTSSRR